MIRLLCPLALFLVSTFTTAAHSADPGTDPDSRKSRALAMNAAMQEAKDHLQHNRPKEAIAVLEKQIAYVNGDPTFLALLREAYVSYLKQKPTDRLEHVQRQLKILDPKLNIDELIGKAKPTPTPSAEVPARPIPGPDVEETTNDPFQQTPRDRPAAAGPSAQKLCDAARSAFEKQQYSEAGKLFAQASEAGMKLNSQERSAWGYCRLLAIRLRLNQAGETNLSSAELEKEAQAAMQLGGEALEKFGQTIVADIRKLPGTKTAAATLPEGWQSIETANFRIIFREGKEMAGQLALKAEEIRTNTFKKWSGAAGVHWVSRCDIHLHPSGADYAQATKKSIDSPGHSSVGLKGGAVMVRRIDLRLDDSEMADLTLPHEVAYVVLSDLFAEQPLPRWADVGMTTLSQPGSQVSRYVRAVPKLAQERKLFKMSDLLKMTDYPDSAQITPFYVQSVALVDFLVKFKGSQTFALYLREAPRRGYEEALQRHYGFRDATELQERWMKYVQGVE